MITAAVLDRLRAHRARALFFVVGKRISAAPQVLDQILAGGHLLGNHTYSHPNDHVMPLRAYYQDLIACQEEVYRCCGVRPQYHRPPQGKIALGSALAPKFLGLRSLLWSQSLEDWRFRTEADAVAAVDRLIPQIQAGDIVLLHDEQPPSLVALDRLLAGLSERGLRFDVNPESML